MKCLAPSSSESLLFEGFTAVSLLGVISGLSDTLEGGGSGLLICWDSADCDPEDEELRAPSLDISASLTNCFFSRIFLWVYWREGEGFGG
uniref:Apt1 n=1 Tax=Arundo donax TaxID=35708 RepID=A0A0A9F075_ARUDO